MVTDLEALDLWEAAEEDYEIPTLPNNPTMAQIKKQKGRKQRNQRQTTPACLLLFHPPSSLVSCL